MRDFIREKPRLSTRIDKNIIFFIFGFRIPTGNNVLQNGV